MKQKQAIAKLKAKISNLKNEIKLIKQFDKALKKNVNKKTSIKQRKRVI